MFDEDLKNSSWTVAEENLHTVLNRLSTDVLQRCVESRDNGLLDNMVSELEQIKNLELHKEALKSRNEKLAKSNLKYEPQLKEGKSRLTILYEQAKRLTMEYEQLLKRCDRNSSKKDPEMMWVMLKSASAELDKTTENDANVFFSVDRTDEEVNQFVEDFLTKRSDVHLTKIQADKLEQFIKDPHSNSGFSLI